MTDAILRGFAPAKINLTLHVTGRRADGYHTLESLVAFADIGDEIELTPADDFSFIVDGPFSSALAGEPADRNLAVRAAQLMAQNFSRSLSGRLRLTKNLPVAAGLGGGSADAAAAARMFAAAWDVPLAGVTAPLAGLGADIAVCLAGKAAWMAGAGGDLSPAPRLPPAALVLVNPGVPCPTSPVFARLGGRFSAPPARMAAFEDFAALAGFLARGANDLTLPAKEVVPEIGAVLDAIAATGAKVTRLCGSGATCFGVFETLAAAAAAAREIADRRPRWWARSCRLVN